MPGSLRPLSGQPREVMAELRHWLASPDGPVVVRTSGSTGIAKDVLLSAAALTASARATESRLGGHGQWLLALPATYVAGMTVLVRSLVSGTEPVIASEHESFAAAAAAMTGTRCYVSLVPTQLHRLAEAGELGLLAGFDAVLIGGASLRPALAAAATRAGVAVVRTYGMSETCGGCVYEGIPLDGVGVRIDGDGVVELTGPVLFDGYPTEASTADVMREGWFRTSDLGELDLDGRLRVLGRADDVVISGGTNVALPAVTQALLAIDGVEDGLAIGVDDDEWGQCVVAVLVGKSDVDVKAAFAGKHPAWAPKQVVWLESLPLLPNGKLDRAAITSTAAGGR